MEFKVGLCEDCPFVVDIHHHFGYSMSSCSLVDISDKSLRQGASDACLPQECPLRDEDIIVKIIHHKE